MATVTAELYTTRSGDASVLNPGFGLTLMEYSPSIICTSLVFPKMRVARTLKDGFRWTATGCVRTVIRCRVHSFREEVPIWARRRILSPPQSVQAPGPWGPRQGAVPRDSGQVLRWVRAGRSWAQDVISFPIGTPGRQALPNHVIR